MSVAVKTVRQRVASAVDSATGFSESKQPYGVFPRDPASVLHLRFACGTPRTSTVSSRQKTANGALVRTDVSVTFVHRIKPKDQVASYDAALDAEQSIIQAVMADTGTLQELQLTYTGSSQRAVDPAGEWFVGEVGFQSLHILALS